MGWSLEAALVVPICTAVLFAGIRMAEPLYAAGRETARLEVVALIGSLESYHIYQINQNRAGSRKSDALLVSPGKILRLSQLLRDDLEIFWRLLPGPE